jgi:GTP-binding protein Era
MPNAGIVTVVGKPNAGKSTLLNRIVGEKLSIVSSKPQSTRNRIVGIHTTNDVQMVIFDTPGLLNPRYSLQKSMLGAAIAALNDADIVLHVVDATEGSVEELSTLAMLDRPLRAPVVVTFNKSDLLNASRIDALAAQHAGATFISAADGTGVSELLHRLEAALPESPFLYPEDEVSTQSVRFFASELVRETALDQVEDELPYSIACEIEEFREGRSPVYIRAVLHVERDSQKRILIGAGGQRIREIGKVARQKIEAFIDSPVYLDLWVKVLPNWRRDRKALSRFGYSLPEDRSP